MNAESRWNVVNFISFRMHKMHTKPHQKIMYNTTAQWQQTANSKVSNKIPFHSFIQSSTEKKQFHLSFFFLLLLFLHQFCSAFEYVFELNELSPFILNDSFSLVIQT